MGLNAHQTSETFLAYLRGKLSAASISKEESGSPSTTTCSADSCIWPWSITSNRTITARRSLAGLTAAVPFYNYISSGLTTSDTTVPGTLNIDLQFPYVPQQVGIDVPDNNW